jgi:hypothetical protein
MSSPTDDPERQGPRVTAILVVHDGAAWLTETLACIAAQARPPDRLIALDCGTRDGSHDLLAAAIDPAEIVAMRRWAKTGDAVRAALDLGDDADWLWLLADDAAPDVAALAELLERVEHAPSIWQVGPKSHSWTDGRLLEAGATLDATGHRDIGLDGPELDQGQRDEADDVLAVATAGSLVRRRAWESLGGLDDTWSAFGDDVDFGWRINAAGGRVVVASRAVVRRQGPPADGPYAARSHPTPLSVRRRFGMQVLLANTSGAMVPVLIVRVLLVGLLRSVGLLVLSRDPSRAGAELRAVIGVACHPARVRKAGARRRRTRELSRRDLRHLFPSTGDKWRRSPLVAGLFRTEHDEPTARAGASYETGPVSEEAESLEAGDSRVAAFLRRPASLLFLAMTLLALAADRGVLSATLHGGRLLPAAGGGASDLWSAYRATWHPVSVGSTATAPPSLAVLALLSTLALGKVWLVLDVILLGAVPLSALTAFLSLRAVTDRTQVRVWASVAYALLPAVTGAIASGRVDAALAAILLPLVIRAGTAVVAGSGAGGWHRPFGAGALLAVTAAMAPVLWVAAAPLLLLGAFLARRSGESVGRTARRLVAAVVTLLVPPLLLLPWTVHVAMHRTLLWVGSGLPDRFGTVHPPAGLDLLLLHVGGVGQPPVWVAAPIVVAAVISLRRTHQVPLARAGVLMLIGGVGGAVALTRVVGVTPGIADSRHWPGILLLLAGAGAVLAATVAAAGVAPALTGHSFGWRQLSAAGLVVLSVVATVTLAGTWLVRGAGGPLSGSATTALPLFTQVELAGPGSPRALVVHAAADGQLSYAVVRRPSGSRLGDADVAPAGGSRAAGHLASAVQDAAAGLTRAGAELQPFGVQFLVVPSGSVSRLAPALAKTATLTVVPAPGATVYRSSLPAGELSVVPARAAGTAMSGNPAAPHGAKVLAADPGSVDVDVPAGQAGRLAVLAEPTNSHWQATLGSTRLSGRTAYGWAQAFQLPAGGGRLRIGYHDGRRGLQLWGELAAVVLVLLLAVPTRRRPPGEVGA